MNIALSEQRSFSKRLLKWYDHHGRKSLPWQRDRDPYRVWLSEIMLQQTQVTAVIPYFERFTERFPDIATLAASPVDEVMQYWSGLGYYARARNLHQASKRIVDEHGGKFPVTLDQVMALPGIGRSTAGAILAFCFDQHQAIMDGNVKRVLTRYFRIAGYPGKQGVAQQLWLLAETLTPKKRVADYTQAIMDLGAMVCRRRADCERCPMQSGCQAFAAGEANQYPTPKPKKVRPVKVVTMLILQNEEGDIFLEQRPPRGIWGGLWSLPELPGEAIAEASLLSRYGLTSSDSRELPVVSHGFTHYELKIRPQWCLVQQSRAQIMDAPQHLWYNTDSPQSIGLPAVIHKIFALLADATGPNK